MPNPFLVIRTVFFGLLVYFHVLILVVASWNITAAHSAGLSAPGASVFLLMSSIFTLSLTLIASLAQLICVRGRSAHVRVECAWTVLLGNFQLAASISTTTNGPPLYCRMESERAMCASSSLLVHLSWLATLIVLTYCLTICITSAMHAASLSDIWTTPVPRVPWFLSDAKVPTPVIIPHLPTKKHAKTMSSSTSSSGESCAASKHIAEWWENLSHTERQLQPSAPVLFTKGRQSADPSRPAWARKQTTRRGIDNPFATPLPRRKELATLLDPPPRGHLRRVVAMTDSQFAGVWPHPETATNRSYAPAAPRTPTVFPNNIADPDLPIPRPSPSNWIRADAVNSFDVYREPVSWA